MKYNWEDVIGYIIGKGYTRDEVVAVINSFVKFIKLNVWDKPIIIHEFLKFEAVEYTTAGVKLRQIEIKPVGHAWWFVGNYFSVYDVKAHIHKETDYTAKTINDILDGMIVAPKQCFMFGGSGTSIKLFKTKEMPAFLKLEVIGNEVVASPVDKKSEHSWAFAKDRKKDFDYE